ncbi:Casein kinase I isoform epsilon, partial [Rhizophlyctis rosea]
MTLTRLETMHNKSVIHCDVKPDNFCIGIDEKEAIVYTIDFGLSEEYKGRLKELTPNFWGNQGTEFTSLEWDEAIEQGRRDDIEGFCSFANLPAEVKFALAPGTGLEVMKQMKKEMEIDLVCAGLPSEIKEFLKYARSLSVNDRPDYEKWRVEFKGVVERSGEEWDWRFPWIGEMPVPEVKAPKVVVLAGREDRGRLDVDLKRLEWLHGVDF